MRANLFCRSILKVIFSFVVIFSYFNFSFAKKSNFKQSLDPFLIAKKQVVDLVLMNQRSKAIALIDLELKNANAVNKEKLLNLKFNTLSDFLNSKSQEAFETAAINLFSDKKKSIKNIQVCLDLEPDNLNCLWLELKYFKKYYPDQFLVAAEKYLLLITDSQQHALQRFGLMAALKNNIFELYPLYLKQKNSKPTNHEENLQIHLLNYEMAIKDKKFEVAKSILNQLKLAANDYPNLIFMSLQLETLENQFAQGSKKTNESLLDQKYEAYRKKCDELPAYLVRKFLFDIELCTRSLN